MDVPQVEFSPRLGLPLVRCEPSPCPYLPDRDALIVIALPRELSAGLYRRLMEHRFRRSGAFAYRPECPHCRGCIPLRVPVDAFRPSRSQRRVWRRNQDVRVELADLSGDDEHYDLFVRYQHGKHGGEMLSSRESFEEFLADSPVDSFEMRYRLDGRLVAVGVVDIFENALSSVYCYYEPALPRRAFGTFSALREIIECRARGLAHWYAGYYIRGCAKMEYKAAFRPYELLEGGAWVRYT